VPRAPRDARGSRVGAPRAWATAARDVPQPAGGRVAGAVDAATLATRIRAELQRLQELAAFQALQIEDLRAFTEQQR
jgi:hypothetical protein